VSPTDKENSIKEEEMLDDSNSNEPKKEIHINKIEPKKIINIDDKQKFDPIVKAQMNKTEPKEFKPYIRSQHVQPKNLSNIPNSNLHIKHYQKSEDDNTNAAPNEASNNDEQKDKAKDTNYWSRDTWKKR